MEYLVEMTTRVPAGTPEETVDDVRSREAAHSRDLATQGALLRLFQPPLQPGEWRTFGLFSASTPEKLEEVLAGMPLRIWRTDVVTPLDPHPNDFAPQRPASISGPEFLVTFTETIPPGTADHVIEEKSDQERDAARQLAEQGHLERLWKLAEPGRALGLYRARDADEMQAILAALPLADWLRTDIVQLDIHPSDPPLVLRQSN